MGIWPLRERPGSRHYISPSREYTTEHREASGVLKRVAAVNKLLLSAVELRVELAMHCATPALEPSIIEQWHVKNVI